MPARTTDTLTVRTLGDVAQHFGVMESTVRAWRLGPDKMPGRPGAWPLLDIAEWRARRKANRVQRRDGTPLPVSKALERYRDERARLAALDRVERESSLVRRDAMTRWMTMLLARLDRAGDAMERRFGSEAGHIMAEAVNEIRRLIDLDGI